MPLYIVDTWKDQFSLPGKQATVYDTLEAAEKVARPLEKDIQIVYTKDDLNECLAIKHAATIRKVMEALK